MSGKNLVRAKMGKKGPQLPKQLLFLLFLEFASLDFFEILPLGGQKSDVGGFLKKNLVRAKTGKKGPKSDVLKYFSNLGHQIFLKFCIKLENIIWHILVKTEFLGKIWFGLKWAKRGQSCRNSYFLDYFSNLRRQIFLKFCKQLENIIWQVREGKIQKNDVGVFLKKNLFLLYYTHLLCVYSLSKFQVDTIEIQKKFNVGSKISNVIPLRNTQEEICVRMSDYITLDQITLPQIIYWIYILCVCVRYKNLIIISETQHTNCLKV